MTAPAFTIVLRLESELQLLSDCQTEDEQDRLLYWLATARPELLELLEAAIELRDEAKAA
jgi:hypothetical protein